MTLDVLAIGEVMAEISQANKDAFGIGFAGDTFNTAVYCANALRPGGQVGYMSRIGTDPLSSAFLNFATDHGIDVTHVSQDPDNNIGIYSVSTDADGERSFHYWREQSAARRLFGTDADAVKMPAARIIYLSGITLAILPPAARQRLIDKLKHLHTTGTNLIAFDSNYRPRLWESTSVAQEVINQMWMLADIALPSIDDELDLFGERDESAVIERFAKRDWKACAIKRGERGPVSPNFGSASAGQFPPAENVIDTTAAGDSFNGAYLAAYLQGKSEIDCLIAGHTCARQVVGVRGAIGAITA